MIVGGSNAAITGPYPRGSLTASGTPISNPSLSPGSVGNILPGEYLYATLPAATAYPPGTIAYTTDQGWQYGNGSIWQALGGGAGSGLQQFTTVTANTTLTNLEYCVLVDCTAGPVTITLPSAVGVAYTPVIKKKDSTANAVTIVGGGTIDGQSSLIILYQNSSVSLNSDNANWWIF
jgi:hypothetical protein